MFRHPRFILPAPPPGSAGATSDLVRIVDPTGIAIAWISSPDAVCIGLSVPSPNETAWVNLLGSHSIQVTLFGEPITEWMLEMRDPTSASWRVRSQAEIAFHARIEDVTLHLEVRANENGATLGFRISSTSSQGRCPDVHIAAWDDGQQCAVAFSDTNGTPIDIERVTTSLAIAISHRPR